MNCVVLKSGDLREAKVRSGVVLERPNFSSGVLWVSR